LPIGFAWRWVEENHKAAKRKEKGNAKPVGENPAMKNGAENGLSGTPNEAARNLPYGKAGNPTKSPVQLRIDAEAALFAHFPPSLKHR